ncbi:hypothetical protein [Phaeobacter phage MD18]|nr:hypothetical protein [Phaeobacter phage MD18]
MKTNTTPRNVSVAAAESSTFSISNNAKIFRILIDGLYADKIQSITREIWSNALDAHVQAGCADRPFDVSFPNPFDPTFRVRDYGVSLSHDQVMHMYTDLGHSTKEDTNDAIGKFGIGSKSPFAYTDNFTVTVYLDGTVRFYSAMIGSDGVPAIHLMGEQPTDEENGVEVAFPVENSDYGAFQNAAKRVSHGFDVKPNVTNIPREEFSGWPELPVLLEGDDWKLLHGAIEGYSQRAYARMGPVLYPINANALGDITKEQRELLGHTFVIDFPMGDLEITASREELSYGRNDPTALSILAKVEEIVEGLTQKCLDDFATCDTYFDACVKYRDQTMSNQIPSAVKEIIKRKARWKGEELDNQIKVWARHIGWECSLLDRSRLGHVNYRFKTSYEVSVPANPKTVIFVEDYTEGKDVKRGAARVKTYVQNNRSDMDQAVWVKVYKTRPAERELMRFFDRFDGVEVVMVNDLPMPAKISRRGSAERRPVQARIWDSYGDFDRRVALDAEDFEEGGLYIPLERMYPVVHRGCHSPRTVILLLKALGALDKPVYGAPKSLWKKFEGDQWVNLYDYAKDWFATQDEDFSANSARRTAVRKVLNSDLLDFLDDYCRKDALSDNSLVHMAMEIYESARNDKTPDLSKLIELAAALDQPVEVNKDVRDELEDELELIEEELNAVYPMLGLLTNSDVIQNDNVIDKVTEYVIMCDTIADNNQPQATIAA